MDVVKVGMRVVTATHKHQHGATVDQSVGVQKIRRSIQGEFEFLGCLCREAVALILADVDVDVEKDG